MLKPALFILSTATTLAWAIAVYYVIQAWRYSKSDKPWSKRRRSGVLPRSDRAQAAQEYRRRSKLAAGVGLIGIVVEILVSGLAVLLGSSG